MSVMNGLLDADPSVRWHVMRDLTDAPAAEVAAERAGRHSGRGRAVGARLLAVQAADGRWGGAAWNGDEDAPPVAFVLVEGTAQTRPNPPDMLAWTTRIAARDRGADLAEAYGTRNAVAGELLVRVTPTRVIAVKNIAD